MKWRWHEDWPWLDHPQYNCRRYGCLYTDSALCIVCEQPFILENPSFETDTSKWAAPLSPIFDV